jgi:hypothetical protein
MNQQHSTCLKGITTAAVNNLNILIIISFTPTWSFTPGVFKYETQSDLGGRVIILVSDSIGHGEKKKV